MFIKKVILSIMIFFCFFSSIQAVTWTKVYGSSDDDIAHVAKQTLDGGYIVIGFSDGCIWLLKLDEYGDSTWSTRFNSIFSCPVDIEIDNDSGFVIAMQKLKSYGSDLRILKTNKYGNFIWEGIYDIQEDYTYDNPLDLDKTSDGGYIIVGNARGGNDEQFIIKISNTGDSMWTTCYAEENYLTSVCETPVGDFITTNYCTIPYQEKTLLKFNSTGVLIDNVYYNDKFANDIEMLNDSNYIVSSIIHLFMINGNLDTIWSKNIGALDTEPSVNGGFVTITKAFSNSYINKFNENGDSLWTVFYGGSGDDVFYSISRTSDGGYICCGCTDSWGAGGYDYYIVKTDSLGYALGIEEQVINNNPEYINISYISKQNENIEFNFSLPQSDYIKLEIFDLSGRLILTPVSDNFSHGDHEVNTTLPNSGAYIYRFTSSDYQQSGKFLVF